MIHYVAGLMFSTDKTKVALILKNRPAWQAGLFNAVGGKIELNETPATAMAREFLEETGVSTQPEEWEFITLLDGEFAQVNFFRMFDDRVFDCRTMESEEIQLVNPLMVPANSVMNIKWLVPLAADTQVVTPRIVKFITG